MVDGLDISISGGDVLDRVVAELRRAEESLPGEIFDAVEQETMRLMELARSMVRSMATHGPKHTGLRNTVADGVGLTQTISADAQHLRVTTSVPQANMAPIPAGLDAGEWHHPLFGMRNHWYTQHGLYSWFTQTFSDGRRDYEDRVQAVLTAARDRIAAAAKS